MGKGVSQYGTLLRITADPVNAAEIRAGQQRIMKIQRPVNIPVYPAPFRTGRDSGYGREIGCGNLIVLQELIGMIPEKLSPGRAGAHFPGYGIRNPDQFLLIRPVLRQQGIKILTLYTVAADL
jgi:hypothetical protein